MGLFRTEWSKSPQKITRLSDGTIAFLDIEYKGSITSQAHSPCEKEGCCLWCSLSSWYYNRYAKARRGNTFQGVGRGGICRVYDCGIFQWNYEDYSKR